jgi:hypothetical protein
MSSLILQTPSALNVDIPGTAGSFKVSRKGEDSKAIEVRYMLTHVSLSGAGPQQQLLDMLAPVREVFDLEQLGFDEIMQRDIDDSRVSLDLIPYLLEHTNTGMVKLFPPIVVVVLPLKAVSNRPAERYAAITRSQEDIPGHVNHKWDLVTAGGPGREQFQFRQLARPDGSLDSNNAVLRIARTNCALAIVDGQHRAMALLALYRNLTQQWSDARRTMYQQYYRVWSDSDIRGYDLTELQMPMIICTFPQLDEAYQGNMDVIRAARRVFLDLNKNAKKVSESRNKLLDDQDMVSHCLRGTLAHVKMLDIKSLTPLRIWNIELDQAQDRSVISSECALSGVSHLYYIVEHVLFTSDRVKGIGARKGRLARSRNLNEAYTRMGLLDEFTQQERSQNTRSNYSDKVAAAFDKHWCEQYGAVLEQMLGEFHPFAAHCKATLRIHEQLKAQNRTKLRSLLFDGQASSRTFGEFRKRLDVKIGDDPTWQTPELKEIRNEVDAQLTEYQEEVTRLRSERSRMFLEELHGAKSRSVLADGNVAESVQEFLDTLYRETFTSIAFEAAVFLTLVEAVEATQPAAAGQAIAHVTPAMVTEYLTSLHTLFKPTTFTSLANLAATFKGNLVETDGAVAIVPTNRTFGRLVIAGEMQPDEWPKYRYLLLEAWSPTEEKLQKFVEADLAEARPQVMKAAFRRAVEAFCLSNSRPEKDVTTKERLDLLAEVVEQYEEFLSKVRHKKQSLADVAESLKGSLVIIASQSNEETQASET